MGEIMGERVPIGELVQAAGLRRSNCFAPLTALWLFFVSIAAGTAWAADAGPGAALFATCTACHGQHAEGNAKIGAPNLTGQQSAYLIRQLEAFSSGRRGTQTGDNFGAVMRATAGLLKTDADRAAVSSYIASLPIVPVPTGSAGAKADLATGRNYFNGICSNCHGSDGKGNGPLSAPRLVGQDRTYILRQYAAFKSGARGADPADTYGVQMRSMTRALPDERTEQAVFDYLSTLGGQGG